MVDLAASPPSDAGGLPAAILARAANGGADSWAVLASPTIEVRVNGYPVSGGLRAIADRDEIRVNGSGVVFFSTETLARVEEFSGAERPVFCGRCRQQVNKGDPAVRCPQCGIWYNQSDKFPCWTYAEKCAFCPQATSLAAGYNWVPED